MKNRAPIKSHLSGASRTVAFAGAVAVACTGVGSSLQGEVAKSAAEAKPLKVGTAAPNSTLREVDGKTVELKQVLGGKPTVLIFYRGGWCPFCNAHLSELAKVEGDLRAMGFQIVAISPDTPAELNKTLDKDHLTYRLFSDTNATSLRNFGVAYRLDDQTFTMYRDRFNIDLESSSGEKHHILPVPSVFLIDKHGKIGFAYSNPDYKVRMKGADIVQHAKKIKG